MKKIGTIIACVVLLHGIASSQAAKQVALTMDDLPLNTASRVDNAELRRITARLLDQIVRTNVPLTGFVNEQKLEVNGRTDPERIAVLQQWLDAGVELGNHTYAHKSQNQVPVPEAKEDILKGEEHLRPLLAKNGKHLRYFRHPFLMTGRDSAKRATMTRFLDSLGYTIAPVTIDDADWIFATAYEKAYAAKDSGKMRDVGTRYIGYMEEKVRFYEAMSDSLFGRVIRQTLLFHASRLNGDYYGALCAMFVRNGYTFITLEEALKDEAYRSKDEYFGGAGISWLDRWALTLGFRGAIFRGDPHVPKDIMEYAGIDYE